MGTKISEERKEELIERAKQQVEDGEDSNKPNTTIGSILSREEAAENDIHTAAYIAAKEDKE